MAPRHFEKLVPQFSNAPLQAHNDSIQSSRRFSLVPEAHLGAFKDAHALKVSNYLDSSMCMRGT